MKERKKTMSKKELAAYYGVSVKTLVNWLRPIEKEIHLKNKRLFTPKELNRIFEFLGE